MTTLVLIGMDNISSFSSAPVVTSSVAEAAPAVDLVVLDDAGMRAAVDAVASAADFSVQPNTSFALQ